MVLCILAVIAFLIFYKLFKEFGRTQRIIINMGDDDKEKLKGMIDSILEKQSGYMENSDNSELCEKTNVLRERLPNFVPEEFLEKAEEMFDTILNAFANSHYYLLKSMLTESLYESFSTQIERRNAQNLRQELLIKHKETRIDKIEVLNEKVKILVIFDISQMSAMVNNEGISIDNPKRIYRDIIYKWVFERAFVRDCWLLSKISIGKPSENVKNKPMELAEGEVITEK